MGRLAAMTLGFLLLFLALAPSAASASASTSAQFTSTSLTVNVYSDGSASVTQVVSANSSDVSINLQLLSSILTDAVAVDQAGSPLSFQISGTNITIYTLGATGVTLRYDTQALTDKQGTVWTLNLTAAYNATLVLPQGSTVTSVSGTPYSYSEQGGSPVIVVPPGSWQVSYGVPISIATTSNSSSGQSSASSNSGQTSGQSGLSSSVQSSSSTTSVSSTSTSPGVPGSVLPYAALAIAAVIIVAVAILFLRRRSGPLDLRNSDLRPDDIQVLNFITEKGGKVFEPEIRARFVLPKTSAWRQIKRLERLGYVKITKVGSQNQIEVIKNRERPQA
jgi:uncharacterized membrane protein